LGVATIRFDLASVFSGLVGSSEKNMREALFMLEGLAPCVVLLDEVDKAISTSGGGDGGTSQKVLGTLLTFMQETKAPIFWVPTLNRTENVPAEFLRTGRLDQVFGVTVPNVREREQILRIHLAARKVDVSSVDGIERIAEMTERFVGAELEGIASEARLLAYNEGTSVREEHLLQALGNIKPLSKRMAAQFSAMEDWCNENATPSSSPYVVAARDTQEPGIRPRRRVQ
jgi:SpoVK/Ycf46/Vps4 family AAA+-type ATPase